MFCSNCGNQLPDGSRFCDVCGAQLGGGDLGNAAHNYAQQGYNPNMPNQAQFQGQNQMPYGGQMQYDGQMQYGGQSASAYQESGSGEMPKNTYVLIMSLGIIFQGICGAVLAIATGDVPSDDFINMLGIVLLIIKTILLIGDSRELKRCGYKISKLWYIIGFLSAPPYLFVRAKTVDHNYKYFWIWILSFPMFILIFLVLDKIVMLM